MGIDCSHIKVYEAVWGWGNRDFEWGKRDIIFKIVIYTKIECLSKYSEFKLKTFFKCRKKMQFGMLGNGHFFHGE